MRAIQQAEGMRPADDPRPSRSWRPAAAAAVLVVAVGLVAWILYGDRQSAPTPVPEQIVAEAEPVEVTLDLRKYSVTRSDAPAEELPPLVLPRAKVRLTLLLPVGSEAGEYEVRVVGADKRTVASDSGIGALREFLTSLEVSLDLREASPGSYSILLRRDQEGWTSFPAEVQSTPASFTHNSAP